MLIDVPKKSFKIVKKSFAACQKLFLSYGETVELVLSNAHSVNQYLREYDLTEYEISRLDEIERDIRIYQSRINRILGRLETLTDSLLDLTTHLRKRKRNRDEDEAKVTAWMDAYFTCLKSREEFNGAFEEATQKWTLIERFIMNCHNELS